MWLSRKSVNNNTFGVLRSTQQKPVGVETLNWPFRLLWKSQTVDTPILRFNI